MWHSVYLLAGYDARAGKPLCLADAEGAAGWEQDNVLAPVDADSLPPFSEAMGAQSAEARMRLFEELPTAGFGCAGTAFASSPNRRSLRVQLGLPYADGTTTIWRR